MLARIRAAGLLVPALMTALVLPVLIGLGTWQWQRLHWKQDLIAKLSARSKAEPVSYVAALNEFVKTGDVEYLRVRVTGTFDHNEERHLYAPTEKAQGYHVYTLLRPEGGFPVFVNRGWVPASLKDPAKRADAQVTGTQTVTGLVRLDEPENVFNPPKDAKGNRWYARDTWAMRWGEAGPPPPDKLALMKIEAYAPFSIDAEAEPANPGGWPKGGTTTFNIPNRHLEYVVTWYGLALTLIIVFVLYARGRLAALDQEKNDKPRNPL